MYMHLTWSLPWRHNGHIGVSNHQPRDCLLSRLYWYRSKKTAKLHVTGLCEGNEFPTQRASIAEKVSIWWRHYMYGMWLINHPDKTMILIPHALFLIIDAYMRIHCTFRQIDNSETHWIINAWWRLLSWWYQAFSDDAINVKSEKVYFGCIVNKSMLLISRLAVFFLFSTRNMILPLLLFCWMQVCKTAGSICSYPNSSLKSCKCNKSRTRIGYLWVIPPMGCSPSAV